jgi:predicted Zn-dependent protease
MQSTHFFAECKVTRVLDNASGGRLQISEDNGVCSSTSKGDRAAVSDNSLAGLKASWGLAHDKSGSKPPKLPICWQDFEPPSVPNDGKLSARFIENGIRELIDEVKTRLPINCQLKAEYHDVTQAIVAGSSTIRRDFRNHWGIAVDFNFDVDGEWIHFDRHFEGREISYAEISRSIEAITADLTEIVHLAACCTEPTYGPVKQVLFLPPASGLLFHEVYGHGLEERYALVNCMNDRHDNCLQLGCQVGHQELYIFDDPTTKNMFGSRNIDDRGEPASMINLVSGGMVVGLLMSDSSAKRYKMPRANHWRSSFRHPSIARTSNLVVSAGVCTTELLLESVESGILVKKVGSARISRKHKFFEVYVQEAAVIRKGRPHQDLRPFVLRGAIDLFWKSILALTNERGLAASYCGSYGGSVPVGQLSPGLLCTGLVAYPSQAFNA